MAEDPHVGILDGAQHAGGHLLAALVEAGMDTGDHDIHLRQHFVVKIEGAVGKNVDLDAGEDADAALHRGRLRGCARGARGPASRRGLGHGQILRVVGDGDVLQAARDGGLRHLADGVAAVGAVVCMCTSPRMSDASISRGRA